VGLWRGGVWWFRLGFRVCSACLLPAACCLPGCCLRAGLAVGVSNVCVGVRGWVLGCGGVCVYRLVGLRALGGGAVCALPVVVGAGLLSLRGRKGAGQAGTASRW